MEDKYIRDENNKGALLNTDISGLQAYKMQKARNREIDMMKKEISQLSSLKNEISELRKLLLQLTNNIESNKKE